MNTLSRHADSATALGWSLVRAAVPWCVLALLIVATAQQLFDDRVVPLSSLLLLASWLSRGLVRASSIVRRHPAAVGGSPSGAVTRRS